MKQSSQEKKVTTTISEAFQQQLVRDNQSLVIPRVPFKPGSSRSYPNFVERNTIIPYLQLQEVAPPLSPYPMCALMMRMCPFVDFKKKSDNCTMNIALLYIIDFTSSI